MITNEHIEQFIAQAYRVGDAGLTICSSGNISWRIGSPAFRNRFMGTFST